MTAIHLHQVVKEDGQITLKGLPLKKGQSVEMILLPEPAELSARPRLTARQLLQSNLIGL